MGMLEGSYKFETIGSPGYHLRMLYKMWYVPRSEQGIATRKTTVDHISGHLVEFAPQTCGISPPHLSIQQMIEAIPHIR